MKRTKTNKIISFIVTFAMMITMFPVLPLTASAAWDGNVGTCDHCPATDVPRSVCCNGCADCHGGGGITICADCGFCSASGCACGGGFDCGCGAPSLCHYDIVCEDCLIFEGWYCFDCDWCDCCCDCVGGGGILQNLKNEIEDFLGDPDYDWDDEDNDGLWRAGWDDVDYTVVLDFAEWLVDDLGFDVDYDEFTDGDGTEDMWGGFYNSSGIWLDFDWNHDNGHLVIFISLDSGDCHGCGDCNNCKFDCGHGGQSLCHHEQICEDCLKDKFWYCFDCDWCDCCCPCSGGGGFDCGCGAPSLCHYGIVCEDCLIDWDEYCFDCDWCDCCCDCVVWNSSTPPDISSWAGSAGGVITIANGARGGLNVPADTTVTITGTAETTGTDIIGIMPNIEAGATIIWEADYTFTSTATAPAVNVDGDGTFIMNSGKIEATNAGANGLLTAGNVKAVITAGEIDSINNLIRATQNSVVAVSSAADVSSTRMSADAAVSQPQPRNPIIFTYDPAAEAVQGLRSGLTAVSAGTTVTWAINGGKSGVNFTRGTNTGFIEIPCVTVHETVAVTNPAELQAAIAGGAKHIIINGGIEINDDISLDGGATLWRGSIGGGEIFVIDDGAELVLANITLVGGGEIRGVSVNNGTLIMNDGTVIKDASVNFGGGVLVGANGTFIMNGGLITDNRASWGGGVYIADGGKLTLNGGIIAGNEASWDGDNIWQAGAAADALRTAIGNIAGTDITLTQDIIWEGQLVIDDGKTFSVDTNGFTLTLYNAKDGEAAVNIFGGGKLVIDDSGGGAVNVLSYSTASGRAVEVADGFAELSSVTAFGSVGGGVYAVDGSEVIISGDIIGVSSGVYASGSQVIVNGNVTSTGDNSVGVLASSGAEVTVTGNIAGVGNGINAIGAEVTVLGDVSSSSSGEFSAAVYAENAIVTVGGDVTASGDNAFGALVKSGAEVTINGTIMSDSIYIAAGTATEFEKADGVPCLEKSGYWLYTDGVSSVWVKALPCGECDFPETNCKCCEDCSKYPCVCPEPLCCTDGTCAECDPPEPPCCTDGTCDECDPPEPPCCTDGTCAECDPPEPPCCTDGTCAECDPPEPPCCIDGTCDECKPAHNCAIDGHIWSNWHITTPATTTAKGERTRTCSECGEAEKEDIPMVITLPPSVIEDIIETETQTDDDGNDFITLDLKDLGATAFMPELFETLADSDLDYVEIIIGGFTFTIEVATINTEALQTFDFGQLEIIFLGDDEEDEIEGINIPENTIIINPPVTGDFGFTLTIIFDESQLESAGFDAAPGTKINLFHIKDNIWSFEELTVDESGNLAVEIGSASFFLLSTDSLCVVRAAHSTTTLGARCINCNFLIPGGSTGNNRPGGGGGSTPGDVPITPTATITAGTSTWTVTNIPRAALTALGLSADIPVNQVRIPTGATGTVSVSIGAAFAGQNAVLVRFNAATGELEFVTASTVGTNGSANINVRQTGDFLVLTFKTGDITGTGEVGTTDALALLRHVAGVSELNSVELFVANGKQGDVNTADALNILRYVAGITDRI